MDLLDLKQEKRFLGLEFLTWVWYQSEVNSGLIELEGLGTVELWFENRLVLEAGSGNARQTVTLQGKDLELAEARTALLEGKKVSQARLRIAAESREWRVTLKAEGLELGSVKAPKTLDADEEEAESAAGRLLDRIAVMQELTRILDLLYARFLAVRLTNLWEKNELPRLRHWLKRDEDN
ncbi:MAG: hypothetical protein AB1896_11295 [Thermodesulfobacteriota bacterium]